MSDLIYRHLKNNIPAIKPVKANIFTVIKELVLKIRFNDKISRT